MRRKKSLRRRRNKYYEARRPYMEETIDVDPIPYEIVRYRPLRHRHADGYEKHPEHKEDKWGDAFGMFGRLARRDIKRGSVKAKEIAKRVHDDLRVRLPRYRRIASTAARKFYRKHKIGQRADRLWHQAGKKVKGWIGRKSNPRRIRLRSTMKNFRTKWRTWR